MRQSGLAIGRRRFIERLTVGALFAPLALRAQPATRVRRIGVLSPGPTLSPEQYRGVWAPLRELGWVEGENLAFERRWANGRPERLRALAEELVRASVDIVVTIGTDATVAAKDATKAIPIVMLSSSDPVGGGIVASLAHPGGNVTGLSMVAPDLDAKRLSLLHELLPRARRIGVLVDPSTSIAGFSREETERAFHSLGLDPVFVYISSSDKLEEAVGEVAQRGGQALVVHDDVLFRLNSDRVLRAALLHGLPAAVGGGSALDAGGVLAYEVDEADLVARLATFVDRILRGAKPADLPVEQPTKFRLTINLKTAKALGIAVPQSLRLRADEVIQ